MSQPTQAELLDRWYAAMVRSKLPLEESGVAAFEEIAAEMAKGPLEPEFVERVATPFIDTNIRSLLLMSCAFGLSASELLTRVEAVMRDGGLVDDLIQAQLEQIRRLDGGYHDA